MSGTANITKKELVVSANAQNKTYDGTINVTSNNAYSVNGLVANENISSATLKFNNASAGIGNKSIIVSNAVGDVNTSISNYNVSYVSSTGNTIDKAELAITVLQQSKTYDGTNAGNVSASTVTGLVSGENISYNLIYSDKNAGSNKTVSVVGLSAGNNTSLLNYNVTISNNTVSQITKKAIMVSASDQSKTYDGTTIANQSRFQTSGVITGENITSATLQYADNYYINPQGNVYTGVANITPKALIISASHQTKIYDGTTNVSNVSAFSSSGLIANESIIGVDLAYTSKNAGLNKTIAISNATSGVNTILSNYNISYVNNSVSTISQKQLTTASGITVANKKYDGNTQAIVNITNAQFDGVISGDQINISNATGVFSDQNVGNNKTVIVSNFVANGADAGNYNWNNVSASAYANITPNESMLTVDTLLLGYSSSLKINSISPLINQTDSVFYSAYDQLGVPKFNDIINRKKIKDNFNKTIEITQSGVNKNIK